MISGLARTRSAREASGVPFAAPPTPRRRWHAWWLFAAWVAYWIALAGAALGRAVPAVWRLASDRASHGGVSLSAGDAGVSLQVTEHGTTAWAGSAGLLAFALCVAIPPLALFLLWLCARPRVAGGVLLETGPVVRPAGVTAGRPPDPRAADAARSPVPDVRSP